jgi:hypothetical protein
MEFGVTGPASSIVLPTTFRVSPPVHRGFFERTEFSLGFDSLERVEVNGQSETRFGEALAFMMRRPVWNREGLSLAVAPKADFFLRNNSGAVIGGKAIAVYGFGLHSLAANVLGAGATSASDDNPAWLAELALGYSRALSSSGAAKRFSLAFEIQNGFSKGQDSTLSLLQMIAFRARPNLVLDLAAEQRGVSAGEFELVLMGGLTYNIGYLWR